MDGRLFYFRMTISGLLDFPLHVDDGFSMEVAGPSDHATRDLSLRLGEDGLDGRDSLPEDKEHDV